MHAYISVVCICSYIKERNFMMILNKKITEFMFSCTLDSHDGISCVCRDDLSAKVRMCDECMHAYIHANMHIWMNWSAVLTGETPKSMHTYIHTTHRRDTPVYAYIHVYIRTYNSQERHPSLAPSSRKVRLWCRRQTCLAECQLWWTRYPASCPKHVSYMHVFR